MGGAIGGSQAEVVARFSNPFAAAITGLFMVVGFRHWIKGTGVMIDDYLRGSARMWSMVAAQVIGWAIIAAVVVAQGGGDVTGWIVDRWNALVDWVSGVWNTK